VECSVAAPPDQFILNHCRYWTQFISSNSPANFTPAQTQTDRLPSIRARTEHSGQALSVERAIPLIRTLRALIRNHWSDQGICRLPVHELPQPIFNPLNVASPSSGDDGTYVAEGSFENDRNHLNIRLISQQVITTSPLSPSRTREQEHRLTTIWPWPKPSRSLRRCRTQRAEAMWQVRCQFISHAHDVPTRWMTLTLLPIQYTRRPQVTNRPTIHPPILPGFQENP
jgi:hypothetical protein